MIWTMCGSLFSTASVMNSLRKSWGVKCSGPPVAWSVRPVRGDAPLEQ
jgi:hypothetical protein